jgi:hypothetical protein
VGAYSGMELYMPIWLNHDHGDGRVVEILVVNAYSGVEVCTPIFLIHKLFLKKNSKHKWTHPLTKLNTNMSMWIIFGSSRNVYVVEEPF